MKKINEKILFEGHWLSVHETIYQTIEGKELTWESVHRKRSTVGVVIVALDRVPAAESFGHEDFNGLAEQFLRAIAEHCFCLLIIAANPTLRIGYEDGIRREIKQRF